MFTLSPATVLRPEPHGALMFQQETAETALLDMEGLDALYFLLKDELRDYPVFFVGYLLEKRFIVRGSPDDTLERLSGSKIALRGLPNPRFGPGSGDPGRANLDLPRLKRIYGNRMYYQEEPIL